MSSIHESWPGLMLVRNANAFIVHGNTLSMECFGGYATRSTALGGVIRPLGAATAKAILTNTSQKVAAHPPGPIAPVPTMPATASTKPKDTPAFTQDKKGQLGFDF